MTRAPHKRLLTPRDPALYPLRVERLVAEPAALVETGDLLAVLRSVDGRQIAMRAPLAGRMLRMMVSQGDVLAAPLCAMTMREEPDLTPPPQSSRQAARQTPTQARSQAEPSFEVEDLFFGPSDGFESLGSYRPAASTRARPARTGRTPYNWIHRNSGEHEAEAPYSKWIWAALAAAALLLVILVFTPDGIFPWEGESSPQGLPPAPQTPPS